MKNPINAINEIEKELTRLIPELQKIDEKILNISKNARATSDNFLQIKTPKDLQSQLKKSQELQDKLTQAYKDQSKVVDSLQKQIEKLKKNRKSGNKELSDQERIERKLQRSKKALIDASSKESKEIIKNREEARKLNRENKALLGSYAKLSNEHRKALDNYRNLAASLGNNATATKRALKEVNRYRKSLDAINNRAGVFTRNVGNYTSAFRGFLSAFGLTSGIFLFATALQDAGKTIIKFDRDLIAVGKTTDLTGEKLQKFGNDVITLGLKLKGISIEGLLKSSEIAGQLGIRGSENILRFASTLEKLTLTSDIVGEESARDFAKFIEVSKDSVQNADRLGSVITRLGNNFATTEKQILSNSTELQKALSIYEISAQSVLGLGAATNALGSEAEQARSAFQTTFAVLDNAISTGEGLEKVLKLTGLTQEQLSRQFRKDAGGVFKLFIKGLADADKEGKNLRNILTELEIKEKRAVVVIGALAKNYETLERALNEANQEYIDNTALIEESDKAAESLSANISDVKDEYKAFILALENGQGPIANAFKSTLGFVKELIEGIKILSLSEKQRQALFSNQEGDRRYIKVQKEIRKEAEETGKTINEVANDRSESILDEIDALERLIIERKKAFNDEKSLTTSLGLTVDISSDRFKPFLDSISEAESLLKIYKKELEASDDLQDDLSLTITKSAKDYDDLDDKLKDSNKSKKEEREIIKGSIEDFENQIKKLKQLATQTSVNSDQYAEFQSQIQILTFQLKLLKSELDFTGDNISLNEAFDFFDNIEESERDLNAFKESLKTFVNDIGGDLDAIELIIDGKNSEEELKELYENLLRLDQEYKDQRIQLQQELGAELNNLALNLSDSLFEIQLQRIDREIDANDKKFERLLENEELSDEQKKDLELQRNQEEKRLLRERAKIENQAFLLEQGAALAKVIVDTTQKVAAIKAQAAVLAANPVTAALAPVALAQVPLVIGVGAAAGASILATTIPAFAEGKEPSDGYTGTALAGEVPGNTEYQLNKKGQLIGVYDKPTLIDTKAGDTIFKDTPTFQKHLFSNSMIDSMVLNNLLPPLRTIASKNNDAKELYGQIKKEVAGAIKSVRINSYYKGGNISIDTKERFRGKIRP